MSRWVPRRVAPSARFLEHQTDFLETRHSARTDTAIGISEAEAIALRMVKPRRPRREPPKPTLRKFSWETDQ